MPRPVILSLIGAGFFVSVGCGAGNTVHELPTPSQQHHNQGFQGQGTAENWGSKSGTAAPYEQGHVPSHSDEVDSPYYAVQDSETSTEKQESPETNPAPQQPVEEPAAQSQQSTSTNSASVTLTKPTNTVNGQVVIFESKGQGPVSSVRYLVADLNGGAAWNIGESSSTVSNYQVLYYFTHGGQRQVTVEALNALGHVVAQDTRWIQVVTTPTPSSNDSSESNDNTNSSNANSSNTTNSSTQKCAAGEIHDCNGVCAKAAWVNDGTCDNGSQATVVFTCPELGMDGSDCGLQHKSPCQPGEIQDCNWKCAKAEWVNDGTCDDGTAYATVFTCAELGYDGNDCNGAPTDTSAPNTAPAGNTPTSGVPYFYQYSNALYPSSSCQNTSIAMVLKYYGWNGVPDTITKTWGKGYAQSPAGLAEVFNSYAKNAGIPQRLVPKTNGTIAGLHALLAQGKPVIIHGYFTGFGHVLVVTGYNGTHYTVNDPAGQWSQVFKGGYPSGGSSTIGHGIKYKKAAFQTAISTLNGSGYAPLWYHQVTQ